MRVSMVACLQCEGDVERNQRKTFQAGRAGKRITQGEAEGGRGERRTKNRKEESRGREGGTGLFEPAKEEEGRKEGRMEGWRDGGMQTRKG